MIDPKPENETVSKLRIASWIWFSGRKRRRRYARETTQRGADSLCLAAGRRGQEGQRSLSGDGGVAAGGLQLEAAIRGVGIERAARVAATARREPQAERDRSGSHVGQAHLAGSAIKKGLKPVKRRELVRQVRRAYRLSESALAGWCALRVGRIVTRAVAIHRPSYASGCGIWPARGSGTVI